MGNLLDKNKLSAKQDMLKRALQHFKTCLGKFKSLYKYELQHLLHC